MIKKIAPSVVSLLRCFFSPYVAILACDEKWFWAWLVMVILLLTDAFDGWMAIKFSTQSFIGGKIIDPIGDLILCVSGLAGMFLTGNLYWDAIVLLGLLFSVIWLSVAMAESAKHRRIYVVLSRVYFLGVMAWLVIFYAWKAHIFQSIVFWLLTAILVWTAWKQRRRLLDG